MKKRISLILPLIIFCLVACSKNSADIEKSDTGVKAFFSGSFIQPWFVHEWSDARWDEEMKMLKKAGMKYLIYASALSTEDNGNRTAIYPTNISNVTTVDNSLEKCLKSAQENGIKIFIGINFNNYWWKCDMSSSWLQDEMEEGNKVIDELINLYENKYPDAFYGWYWTWEVANIGLETVPKKDGLANALNVNLDHINKVSPQMPLMLSPFMNHVYSTASQYAEMWKYVFSKTHFRKGDIFVPQDCVGGGGLTIDIVEQWFAELKKAVDSKDGLLFWANTEIFTTDGQPAPFDRVKEQIKKVNPYISDYICFAYSHYYSPYVVNLKYNNDYLDYISHLQ